MKNDINDIIKNHVDSYESKIDPQEIWEGILNKQKPKKRFFFYWLPFACIAVVGLSFILINSDNSDQVVSELISEGRDINEKIASTNDLASLQEGETKKAIQTSSPNSINNEESNPKDQRKNTQNLVSIKSISSLGEDILNNTNASTFSTVSKEEVNLRLHEKTGSAFFPNFKSRSTDQVQFTKSVENNFLSEKLSAISSLRLVNSLINIESKEDVLDDSWNSAYYISPSKQFDLIGISAMFYGGIATNSPSIGKSMEAYSTSISVHKELYSNFSLAIGLSMDRLYEKFQWEGNYIIDGDGEEIGLAAEDDQGNPVVNFGSAQYDEDYYEIVERRINKYNRYEFIDLPVMVTYAMKLKKLRANLSVGAAANLKTSLEIIRLDALGIPQENDNDYKVGPKFLLGLELSYPVTSRLSLNGGINYSKRHLTFRSSKNSIDTYMAGLGLGIRL